MQSRPAPLGKGVDAEHFLINEPAAPAGPAAHEHGWQAGAAVTVGPGGCVLHQEVKPSSEVQFSQPWLPAADHAANEGACAWSMLACVGITAALGGSRAAEQ